jgi:hypothetical protein
MDTGLMECACCGRQKLRKKLHALPGGVYICRRCGLWVALRLRRDDAP